MNLSQRRLWVISCLVIGLTLSAALPMARADDQDSGKAALRNHSFDPEGVRDFWSSDRMRRATADVPSVTNVHAATARVLGAPSGVPGRVTSRPPRPRRQAAILARTAEVATNYTAFPLSTSGKLFSVDSIGQLFVCSATVVNSDNLSVVWTAGHCVHEGNGGAWFEETLFVPAYKDGSAPLGEWPVIDAYVPTGWTDNEELWQYDMAALVVAPEASGTPVADVTGARGIAWNESQDQYFEAYGYPSAGSFTGERMYVCDSSVTHLAGNLQPPPMGISCDMSQGASGGGWIISDEFINSNTSFGVPTALPGVLFGPYFNDVTAALHSAASAVEVPGLPSVPETPINVYQTKYDRNDTRGVLDISEVSLNVSDETVTASIRMHDRWSPSVLAKPSNNIYVDLDPQADGEPDYYAWVYATTDGGLVASIERYTAGESETVGRGHAQRTNGRTVRFSFDLSLLENLSGTVKWYASTKFRNRTVCPRPCWDYSPNHGMSSIRLY